MKAAEGEAVVDQQMIVGRHSPRSSDAESLGLNFLTEAQIELAWLARWLGRASPLEKPGAEVKVQGDEARRGSCAQTDIERVALVVIERVIAVGREVGEATGDGAGRRRPSGSNR